MQRAGKKKCIAAALETLESRTLMSASVSPSGGNDTAAIQNAINSTAAGQTVDLGAGTYHVSSALNLNGHTLLGVAGQTKLQWTGGSNSYLINTGSNSTVENVDIIGAGILVTDSSSNVTITNDTIENVGDTGISAQGGSNNLQITHNTLQNIGGYGMVLYSINETHVDYNTINNAYEGIHSVNFEGNSAGHDCTFDHNSLTGIERHGIEVQNPYFNLSVGWNYLANWRVQPGGNSHIALSIATGPDKGVTAENVDVHDNVLLGNGDGVPSNPNYCFTAIEIMGDHSIINHNYIANWGWGVLVGWSSNWQDTNNAYVGVTSQNGKDSMPEENGNSPSVDSGNAWTGSWDGNVPSAWSNAGVNGTTTGSSSTPAVAQPTSVTATSPNSSQINVAWADQTGGKATYTVQIKSTHGTDPYVTVATLPAGSTSYSVTGLTQNWEYTIEVTAIVGGQTSSPSLVQDQVQQAVASTGGTSSAGTGSTTSTGKGSTTSTSTGSTKTSGSTTTVAVKTGATSSSSSSSSSTAKTTAASTAKQKRKALLAADKVAKQSAKAAKAASTTKKKSKKVSATPPAAVAAAPGHGLTATFYKGKSTKNKVASQVTANVNYTFNGKGTSPSLTSPAGKTNFSVVWKGQVEAPKSGTYHFVAKSDDGARVIVNGKRVVKHWNGSGSDSGNIKLVAGKKYDIEVDYFQKKGASNMQLMWATKGIAREVVPDEDLYLSAAA